MQTCSQCNQRYEINAINTAFYQRIGVHQPKLCSSCRRQRRLAHRNERYLYQDQCGLCKKNIISQYNPKNNLTVYCRECWWSDKWDPLNFGKKFDCAKSFFEQWHDLITTVPHLNLLDLKSENSDYTHLVSNNRSCYLIFSSDYNEQCYYSNWLQHCKNCMDCFHVTKAEQSYQCFFGERLYNCKFLIKCFSSTDSNYCYDCRNIQNCTLSYNLRNKQYCIFNIEYSEQEYNQKISELKLDTSSGQTLALKQFKQLIAEKAIHSFRNQLGRIENSSGDYLANTKDCNNCFNLSEADKCSYVYNMVDMKDSMDCEFGGEGEFGYENIETFPMPKHSIGNINSYAGNDNFYSFNCMSSKFILGCACLKKQEYCILNKKYSENEYNILKQKIVQHMKQTGEWGEFMPIKYSLFAYNETNAQDYFPVIKSEAQKNGWKWQHVDENCNSHLHNTQQCKACQKNFKLIPQEIEFYKQHNLPEPDYCYQCRYSKRLEWRNKNKLYKRQCYKCKADIKTTYHPDRLAKIFCEDCYRKEMY